MYDKLFPHGWLYTFTDKDPRGYYRVVIALRTSQNAAVRRLASRLLWIFGTTIALLGAVVWALDLLSR